LKEPADLRRPPSSTGDGRGPHPGARQRHACARAMPAPWSCPGGSVLLTEAIAVQ
jgi:hypothetical protein